MNQIRYIGYDIKHDSKFIFDLPNGHDCWLFLLTHTPANFFVNGRLEEYPAYSAVLFPPNKKIYYSASQSVYENDWIRFDSAEPFVEAFPIQGHPFSPKDPEYCRQIIKLLAWEHAELNEESDQITHHLLSVLFKKLLDQDEENIKIQHQLVQLRKEIYNSPEKEWSVKLMAEKLHISQSYLQAIYREKFNISCMNDVISRRINYAQDQLLNSNLSVNEVAIMAGYQNIEHFHRQFKKITNQTPLQYRQSTSIKT
ncbi:MAG TPA: helix-turn-helix transcriptional regulator [Bacilli bacterium]|nr:helix-turn-helix transcriptional regulator [Bacilli bacterium]